MLKTYSLPTPSMKPLACQALLLVALLAGTPAVLAQTGASSAAPSAAPPVQRAGGIEYVSGGIGEESRAALQGMQSDFPLRLVFSAQNGEYFVADTVAVRNAQGQILALNSVGPILMLKLPPGDYTVNAIYAGRTEQKQVKVGSAAQTLNWRW